MEETREETVDFNDIEIFSTGTWEGKGSRPGGDIIDEEYLDKIVDSYNKIGNKVKPRLRLSHDKNASDGLTGMAALGWITDLKRKGKSLTANFKSVPKKIAKLIDNKAFGRFSPGIWEKMNINGEMIDNVLDHVALLGADIPANTDLNDFIDLYYDGTEKEGLKSYTKKIPQEEKKMEENKMEELEGKLAEYEKKEAEIESKLKEFEQKEKEYEEKIKEYAQKEVEAYAQKVDAYLDSAIKEKKILPSQKHVLMAMASISDQRTYSYIENDEQRTIEGSSFDLLKEFIDNQQPVIDSNESSQPVEVEKLPEEDKLHNEIKKYAKENNVSYPEAYDAIANKGDE